MTMDYGATGPEVDGGVGSGWDNLMSMLVPGLRDWRAGFAPDGSGSGLSAGGAGGGFDMGRLLQRRPNAQGWLDKLFGQQQQQMQQIQQQYQQGMQQLQGQVQQSMPQMPMQALPVGQPQVTGGGGAQDYINGPYRPAPSPSYQMNYAVQANPNHPGYESQARQMAIINGNY